MVKDLSVIQAKRYGSYNCHSSTSLMEAARQMTERNISALVIVDDDGYLAGIITRTDLVRACYEQASWGTAPVADYMNRSVVTVEPDARLEQVMKLLLERHIHRVVVVRAEDGRYRPIAVLSAADVVYHMVNSSG
jgi:CBS domain-containing protein